MCHLNEVAAAVMSERKCADLLSFTRVLDEAVLQSMLLERQRSATYKKPLESELGTMVATRREEPGKRTKRNLNI